jgi:hypothetical protein
MTCGPYGPAGEGLSFTIVHSGTVGTKIPYQMKAEGAWEKDGKSAVNSWEKGRKAKKGGSAGSRL